MHIMQVSLCALLKCSLPYSIQSSSQFSFILSDLFYFFPVCIFQFIMISTRKLYNVFFITVCLMQTRPLSFHIKGVLTTALEVGVKPLSQSCFSFSKFLLKTTHGTDVCVHGSERWPQIRFWVNSMQVLTGTSLQHGSFLKGWPHLKINTAWRRSTKSQVACQRVLKAMRWSSTQKLRGSDSTSGVWSPQRRTERTTLFFCLFTSQDQGTILVLWTLFSGTFSSTFFSVKNPRWLLIGHVGHVTWTQLRSIADVNVVRFSNIKTLKKKKKD